MYLFVAGSKRPDLGDSLLKANPSVVSNTLIQLVSAMRYFAVIPVATGVLRTELLQQRQERDKPFCAFTARVCGKAGTCEFTTCECGKNIDYTDHVICDILLNGIGDTDIRRKLLGTSNILKQPVNDVIALVESKEMARNALPSSSLSAVSSFRHQQNLAPVLPGQTPSQSDQAKQATCPDCKTLFNVFTEGSRGWNTKPHQVCINCYRARCRRKCQPRQHPDKNPTVNAVEADPVAQLAAVNSCNGMGRGAQLHSRHQPRRCSRPYPPPSLILCDIWGNR